MDKQLDGPSAHFIAIHVSFLFLCTLNFILMASSLWVVFFLNTIMFFYSLLKLFHP